MSMPPIATVGAPSARGRQTDGSSAEPQNGSAASGAQPAESVVEDARAGEAAVDGHRRERLGHQRRLCLERPSMRGGRGLPGRERERRGFGRGVGQHDDVGPHASVGELQRGPERRDDVESIAVGHDRREQGAKARPVREHDGVTAGERRHVGERVEGTGRIDQAQQMRDVTHAASGVFGLRALAQTLEPTPQRRGAARRRAGCAPQVQRQGSSATSMRETRS